jgi:hypothetical protein
MSEFYDEEKLRFVLKNIYRPVQVSPAFKQRVLRSVIEHSFLEVSVNPSHFLLRQPAWALSAAILGLVLISLGFVFPPG